MNKDRLKGLKEGLENRNQMIISQIYQNYLDVNQVIEAKNEISLEEIDFIDIEKELKERKEKEKEKKEFGWEEKVSAYDQIIRVKQSKLLSSLHLTPQFLEQTKSKMKEKVEVYKKKIRLEEEEKQKLKEAEEL